MRSLLFLLLLLPCIVAKPQGSCTTPGQTPSSAFPVCGTSVFTQVSVPICGGTSLPSPHCTNQGLSDKNPFFYKFTCFQSGTLGFLITPKTLAEDYDWELYDVTGIDPNSIYTNGTLVVASNWSGEFGLTGASAAGNSLNVCAGTGQPLFSRMPTLQAGHNYLLLVSHFSDSQSGYTLEFKGGTAVITDASVPHLSTAAANCGGDVIRVKLNKKIKCSSLAANGSDFRVSPAGGATILSATGIGCSGNFDTDSIEVRLDRFLAPGTYTLNVQPGSDGNTLLDYCDNAVPTTDVASFTLSPNAPSLLDSLAKLSCAPRTLQLVFSKPIICSTIAADGSDFLVNGSYPVSVSAVSSNCGNGLAGIITLTLSQQLQQAGSFTLQVRRGSDGNTLINECGTETPVGSSIGFTVKDTVNAAFTYSIQYGCTVDEVSFVHPGGQGVNSWKWNLDDGLRSDQQSPRAGYTVFGPKNIELIVSNGFCADTSRATVMLENELKAAFTVLPDNCPLEPVVFTSASTGKITQHSWDFGDGRFGSGATASHTYARPPRETTYNVRYTVTDSFGCSKTVQKPVTIYISCSIAVPNAFSPNGDRKNDFLYPLNAIKADKLEFTVYNRWGQLVFRTNNWKQGWDGRFNGQLQPAGTYVWLLRYVNRDTNKLVEAKGFSVLIR
jgi:gliding motility-associated-like protein